MASALPRKLPRKWILSALVLAGVIGFSLPASAGGRYGHGVHGSYYGGYYGGGFTRVGYRHGFRGRGFRGGRAFYGRGFRHRRFRHGRYHRRGGAGRAAAIGLGVVGGAIILNELAENRSRRRIYDDYYYDRRYRARAFSQGDQDAFQRGFEEGYARGRTGALADGSLDSEAESEAFQRGFEEGLARGRQGGADDFAPDDGVRAPDAAPSTPVDEFGLDDLDSQLDGARIERRRNDGGPAPIRIAAGDAYRTCTQHARTALGDRGFILAAPASPETAEDVGRGWKMTATVSAQNQAGESWSRAMYCEADADRVYMLELI
ncbi:MAG: hypothetical protein AAGD92_01240 [Pseudomonadota bacterium]